MRQTEQTLLEQMQITEFEIDSRKQLVDLTDAEVELLKDYRATIEPDLDLIVEAFYNQQTQIPEVSLLIGDADTLGRLSNAMYHYVVDLFSGVYDEDYVNSRLRIGLIHKRIGVDTKLYLASIYQLKLLLCDHIRSSTDDQTMRDKRITALERLLIFDTSLVFETYIRGLISEIEISRQKSEQYARSLEETVRARTAELEHTARTDSLTGLLSVRYLHETLTRAIRSAERRKEPIALIYFDVNKFKAINDLQGHQRGDEVLRHIGDVLRSISRHEDCCFRYGGDEFCVVLPNCTQQQARDYFIARINETLERIEPDVSLSFGVVGAGIDEYPTPDQLIACADQAMYQHKQECHQAMSEQKQGT